MIFWRPAREDDGGGGFVSPDSFTVKDQGQPRFRSFGSPMGTHTFIYFLTNYMIKKLLLQSK
ncbi:hypothetical protein Hanom_Chr12g01148361 [Helianthus anomalus]